jgi:hypothetical protein
MEQVTTLTALKRFVATPGCEAQVFLYLVNGEVRPHKFEGVWRKVRRAQTNAIELVDNQGRGSWLDYGKASDWAVETFQDETAGQIVEAAVLAWPGSLIHYRFRIATD